MTTEQEGGRIAYPTLPNPLTTRDLKQLFTPWPDEIEWAFSITWIEEGRLGLLILLKVFETLGRFIPPKEIPPEIVRHIAQCTGLPEKDSIVYAERTLYRHPRTGLFRIRVKSSNLSAMPCFPVFDDYSKRINGIWRTE